LKKGNDFKGLGKDGKQVSSCTWYRDYDTSQNTACWGWKCLKWRNTNTPTQAVQSNTVLYSLVDQVL
jgi:hypothetical protein